MNRKKTDNVNHVQQSMAHTDVAHVLNQRSARVGQRISCRTLPYFFKNMHPRQPWHFSHLDSKEKPRCTTLRESQSWARIRRIKGTLAKERSTAVHSREFLHYAIFKQEIRAPGKHQNEKS